MPSNRSPVQSSVDVSVVLPTFNRVCYIEEALVSLLAQSCRPREIIVVDDGSTEDVASVCVKFGDAVRYERMACNLGKSAAINRGLGLANGEYVWIMDDDDIVPPHALEMLHAPLAKYPNLGFSYGRLQKFWQTPSGVRRYELPQTFPDCVDRPLFAQLMQDCFITGQPCTLIRKRCFDQIAPLDEKVRVSVDYNVLLQLARRFDGYCVDEVVLWQRQHFGVRGPAALSYSAGERTQRWAAADKELLRDLLAKLELPEFVGYRTARRLTPKEQRRALVQKAVIAARKNLWPQACAALKAARMVGAGVQLSREEGEILKDLFGSRYGIGEVIADARIRRAITEAAGKDRLGVQMRSAMASRLTFWIGCALRRGEIAETLACLRALIDVAGADCLKVGVQPLWKRIARVVDNHGPQSEPVQTSP